MSSLEKLVPPLELCEQIPHGEFEFSALVWKRLPGHKVPLLIRNKYTAVGSYPAPTAEEILAEIATLSGTYAYVSVWADGCAESAYFDSDQEVSRASDTYESASEAALRLWFKVKGIEVKE